MQWIAPIASCAGLGIATWIMWQTVKGAARRNIVDATRWRMIDRLRQHWGNVDVWCPIGEDEIGRIDCGAGMTKTTYTAATIDVALAQAINDVERSTNAD